MLKGRVNKCIELLEQGQTVFAIPAPDLTYDEGRGLAQTWADWIWVDFEHGPFDVAGLTSFMCGLRDGGPTPSGHPTPTVVTTLPARGISPEEIIYNAWQISHILTAGVHGIQICHVRNPEAVRAFVACARYPFQTIGRDMGLPEGLRGSGHKEVTSSVWDIEHDEYVKRADPWPLNPDGELLLGIKLESHHCLPIAGDIAAVPGISFCDWGITDMMMSLGGLERPDFPFPGELGSSLEKIKSACDKAGIAFSAGWRDDTVSHEEWVRFYIEEFGGRITTAPNRAYADFGRELTGRTMPV